MGIFLAGMIVGFILLWVISIMVDSKRRERAQERKP